MAQQLIVKLFCREPKFSSQHLGQLVTTAPGGIPGESQDSQIPKQISEGTCTHGYIATYRHIIEKDKIKISIQFNISDFYFDTLPKLSKNRILVETF